MLDREKQCILEGAMYWVGARIAKQKRTPEDWSISLLLDIHKDVFKAIFPEHAGKIRAKEVAFRSHVVPTPGQIQYRLSDIVKEAREIIQLSASIEDDEERIQAIFPRIARMHADCVVVQPFIDGNKRWARQVLSAILVDCGFWPGARINASEQGRYMDGIDKAVTGAPEQLAELIIEGWLDLEEDFSAGVY